MPIPEVTLLADALRGLALEAPGNSGAGPPVEIVPKRFSADASGLHVEPPVRAIRTAAVEIALESLLDRIGRELKRARHPSGPAAARAVLGVHLLLCDRMNAPLESLNELLASVVPASCSEVLVADFPPHPDLHAASVGGFTFGPLDREKLVYRCEKAGCDFFARYPNEFLSRFAVERSPIDHPVIDIGRFRERLAGPRRVVDAVVDSYFNTLSAHHLEEFRDGFERGISVAVALGAPLIDLRDVATWGNSTFVSTYVRIGGRKDGYFCPLGMGRGFDFASVDRRIPTALSRLRERFGWSDESVGEAAETIRKFASFLVRARAHAAQGRTDEAFLHHVIALDLLLGEEQGATRSVSAGAGVILLGDADQGLKAHADRVKRLYDVRSQYVHSGRPVDPREIEDAAGVTGAVLSALLRYQSTPAAKGEGATGRWLRLLDYLATATEAGKPPSGEDRRDAGLGST